MVQALLVLASGAYLTHFYSVLTAYLIGKAARNNCAVVFTVHPMIGIIFIDKEITEPGRTLGVIQFYPLILQTLPPKKELPLK